MQPNNKAHVEEHQRFNEDINKLEMLNNRVLCKQLTHNIDKPIKGIFYPPKSNKNNNLPINADRVYEVTKLPNSLIENKDILWTTEIELEVGDIVWTNLLSALNSPEIKVGKDTYRMLRYHDLIVAKRNGKVIPLNGNLIMSNVVGREVVGWDFETGKKQYAPVINYAFAYVDWKGKSNKGYRLPVSDKGKDVKKGSLVVLDLPNKNASSHDRNYIEHDWRAMFSENRYFYHQRKDILAIVKPDNE